MELDSPRCIGTCLFADQDGGWIRRTERKERPERSKMAECQPALEKDPKPVPKVYRFALDKLQMERGRREKGPFTLTGASQVQAVQPVSPQTLRPHGGSHCRG